MNLLSDNAMNLAMDIRSREGADRIGVGPDVNQLVELWGSRDPAALRPAIDELERLGFIRVDKAIGSSSVGVSADYNVQSVAGIAITETLQEYLDNVL